MITTSPRPVRLATPAQITYATKLMDARSVDVEPYGLECLDVTLEEMPMAMISGLIDYLKTIPRRTTPPAAELEAGMYRLDGEIFKVQQAIYGSGRMYAKVLRVSEPVLDEVGGAVVQEAEIWFEREPGAIRRLRPEHRMALEEAKAFGSVYGVCCVCARTLTDETSIAEGIGPICGGRV